MYKSEDLFTTSALKRFCIGRIFSIYHISQKKPFLYPSIKNKLKNGNTVIAPIKNNICSYLIAGNKNTVGIRVPDHLFCKKLSKLFPHPITSTSVNRTGEKPLTKPDDISNEFISDIDLIIDDGIINGVGSKIFLFKNGSWEQLR